MTLDARPVIDWLLDDTRESEDDGAYFVGFVHQLIGAGVRLLRASTSLRPLDPQIWVRNLRWERGELLVEDRAREVQTSAEYVGSPIAAIHGGEQMLRERLTAGEPRFHTLRDFARRGATDYVIHAIASRDAMRTFVSYTTAAPDGFSDDELALFTAIHPAFSAGVRLRTTRMTRDVLLRTYLGPNAADRVRAGEVVRGSGEMIGAAIWFCDLRDFTMLSDALPADRLIRVLDRYFETVSKPIVDHGGEILKFIGDAMLAIFPVGALGPGDACARAVDAALAALEQFETEVARMEPDHRLGFGVSLHLGEVFYGNIGACDRLDFTVIGSAVNLAARVQGQCSALGTPLLVSGTFADNLERTDLRHLGSPPLKGIRSAPELYTLARFVR